MGTVTKRTEYRGISIVDIDRELCRRSLAEFAKQAWHVIEPGRPYVHGWHIDAICEHLEAVTSGQIRNLLINMPPRHMKSLLVSVLWPAWSWINHPESRWLFSSYADTLSVRDSVKCRRVLTSPWYQRHFGHIFQLTGDQNEKKRFENDCTGYRIATSVGGAGTGEGGDFIVCDDPHKVGDAESRTIRESVLEWWDGEMSTRGNDPKRVGKVIVMQRVHQADLSGHLLARGGYEHLCLPAEYEGRKVSTAIGWEDPRKTKGDLLWPAQFGKKELDQTKKELGSRQSAGQLQQRPASEDGDIIQRSWIQYYRELPPRIDEWILSLDATFTGKAESDYVALQCWARFGSQKYFVDQIHDQLGITKTIDALLRMSFNYQQATLKLIENKANGPAIEDLLKQKVSGIVLWEPQGDKVSRLHAVAPQFEAGNVWFPHPDLKPWVTPTIEELLTFPNSIHDDRVDALTMALLRLEENASSGAGLMRIIR